MMQKTSTALTTAALLAAIITPTAALALEQGEGYAGGGIGRFNLNPDESPNTEPSALIGRVGYGLSDYVGLESRFGFGMSGDTSENAADMEIEADIDELFGVYLTGYLPSTAESPVSLYGLAGMTNANVTITPETGPSASERESGFSYGVGAEVDLSDRAFAYLEWASYLDEDAFEVSGVTIGSAYRF